MTWTAGTFYMNNSSVLNNQSGALFNLTSNNLLNWNAGTAGTFNNSGTFRKSAGTGTSTIANPFNNTGTVDVQTGTIDITGSFSNFSAQTLTGGTYDIQSTFNFTGADIVTNAATIILDGASAQIQSGTGLANFATNASGGSFEIKNGANFTSAGAISNAGTLTVGSGSGFTVGGGGKLHADLRGNAELRDRRYDCEHRVRPACGQWNSHTRRHA